jgi:hypothetical protein
MTNKPQVTLKLLAGAVLLMATGNAQAVLSYVGDTTGGPVFHRSLPGSPPNALSSGGTAVRYSAQAFSATLMGSYTVLQTSTHDSFAALYLGSFDPLQPLTNLLVADDDAGPGANSMFTTDLNTGTNYTLVSTAWGNNDFGAFTVTFTPPAGGDIILATVPEPGSMALGASVLGLAFKRRRRTA